MTACPAATSRVPPWCSTRSNPFSTIVNSSNSGAWPGSSAALRAAHVGDAGGGSFRVDAADVFVDEFRFVAGGLDAGGLGNECGHELGFRVSVWARLDYIKSFLPQSSLRHLAEFMEKGSGNGQGSKVHPGFEVGTTSTALSARAVASYVSTRRRLPFSKNISWEALAYFPG